jgi:hypothetical protein
VADDLVQIVKDAAQLEKEMGVENRKWYDPSSMHGPSSWGTTMDLDDKKQVYSYFNGKIYEFQPDNVGAWHGYPVLGNEAPVVSILRQWRDSGLISNSDYNRFIRGSM